MSTFSLTRNGGGVYEVLRELSREPSLKNRYEITALGPEEDGALEPDWQCRTKTYRTIGPQKLGYSTELRNLYRDIKPDLCHVHGVWMHYSKVNLDYCKASGIPYVISPHGMLDRWALRNSRWKKQIARRLFEDKHLQGATHIHALCEAEAAEIRNLGLTNSVRIIPNGVTISPPTTLTPKWDFETGRPIMLFLGRLHPKKGLLEFLNAWHAAQQHWRKEGWGFAIAGWGQSDYAFQIQTRIREFGMENDVKLVGPLFGEEKHAALQNSAAFVLPSFSEGLPVAVLEAWASRLPVLMTSACNLSEGFHASAAIEICMDQKKNAEGLVTFLQTAESDRRLMGEEGLKLVKSKFTWNCVGHQFSELYDSCLT